MVIRRPQEFKLYDADEEWDDDTVRIHLDLEELTGHLGKIFEWQPVVTTIEATYMRRSNGIGLVIILAILFFLLIVGGS